MKQIAKPNEFILSILKKELPANGSVIHISQFCIQSGTLLFHTFTKEVLDLEDSLLKNEIVLSEENRNSELINYMYTHQFYVREGINEAEVYCSTISAVRALKRKKGLSGYTIIPTTFCNARCFYCYELDYHFTSMSEETADLLVSFIENTHGNNKVHLRWFGGEPLVGLPMIRRITSQLNQKRIIFDSYMISNASLFTPEIAEEALTQWHLTRIQITLDGTKEEYLRRKAYFDHNERPHFEDVISAINEMQKNRVEVVLRLNVDFDNLQNHYELADQLKEMIPFRDRLVVHAAPLMQVMASYRFREILEECFRLQDYYRNLGFYIHTYRGFMKLKDYYCTAASLGGVSIDPKGDIYTCEYCFEGEKLGNISSTELKKRNQTASLSDLLDKCVHCAFLPCCTEFTGCPEVNHKNCRQVNLQMAEYMLKLLKDENPSIQ